MMALGLRGPDIGQMLQMLLEAVMDGEADNDRAALLALAKEKYSW